jgi:hypothetical protein
MAIRRFPKKNFLLLAGLWSLSSVPCFAWGDIDLVKLAGDWDLGCTQSQSDHKQGYMTESYTFEKSGKYTLVRKWFSDSECKDPTGSSEKEYGSIDVKMENTNNGFNPPNTFEVKYKPKSGSADTGLLWVDQTYSKMRLARGTPKVPNNMLGLFKYSKL